MKKKSRRKNKEWREKLNGKIAFYLSWCSLVISILIVFAPIDYKFKPDMMTNPLDPILIIQPVHKPCLNT